MSAELEEHLELRIERNIENGMSPEEARYAAMRSFGGVEQIKEQCRDQRGWVWLEQFIQDFRFSFRSLSRQRSFTLVTVMTLALGIGSAAAIFSVTDWILFRSTKFSPTLFLIGGKNDDQGALLPIRFDFMAQAYQDQTNVMSAYAKAAYQAGNVVIDGQPVATGWLGVSSNLFQMLGTNLHLGRGFLPGEDTSGSDQVVIVSHQFWKRQLHGEREALGRLITVGDRVCTLVGVLAEGQVVPAYFFNDIYRPLTYKVNAEQPWLPELFLLGQLRPGVSRDQAEKALAKAKPAVPPTMQQYLAKDRPVLSSMTEVNQTFRVEMYWMILGAVGFVYAIACLNASNLMLVRMLGRRRELSIRLALGGGRWRIVRLLALESVTLAMLASLAGLLIANWLFPLLMNVAGSTDRTLTWKSWTLNWRVAGVMGVFAVVTSLLIAMVPAIRVLRTEIYSGLKDGGAALGESRALARLRGLFVILQAAFAVILLAGAGLMIQTFQNFRKVDLGFDPAERAKIQINFPVDYPAGDEVRLNRLREIQSELRRIPGVRDAGFGTDLLLPGFYYGSTEVEGLDGKSLRLATANFGLGYQEAAGLKLKAGRWLNHSNGNEIMINEAVARALWTGQNAVGQSLRLSGPSAAADAKGWLVVGVVGDIRVSLRDSTGLYLYGPEEWAPMNMNTFIVSLARDYDEALIGSIRQALYKFDARIVVSQITSLTGLTENQLWAEKLADSILKVLAGIALLLTVVGILSVLGYTVNQRMGEFGVRLALGATSRDLIRLVVRRGVLLSVTGIVLGLGGAMALTRYLRSLLFETSAQDPKVFTAVAVVMMLTCVVACVVPARRATKVDITKLLRSE